MSLYLAYYLMSVVPFILLTWSLYVPFRAGQLYNGPIYCMAIGGYFAAFACRDLGWTFWVALVGALVIGTMFGFIPALGFSRTTGIATAMASISLIFITQSVIRNLQFLGGPRGFWYIPQVDNLLLISYGIVLAVGILIYRLDHSRIGRALEAIFVDPNLAASMGVNVRWTKTFVLTLSSAIGAIAGVIYAFSMGIIYPDSFGFTQLLYVWAMLCIGGRYTMWGALITAPVLWGLPQWVPQQVSPYTKILYGAILVIILILRPEGLISRRMVKKVRHIFSNIPILWNR